MDEKIRLYAVVKLLKMGGRFPSLPSLSLHFPPLPSCREAAPENQIGAWESAIVTGIQLNGCPRRRPGRKHILVYFEIKNSTWRQHFLTNALRKN